MSTLQHAPGGVYALGGEWENWGIPVKSYVPPSDWNTPGMRAKRDDWLMYISMLHGFATLGVAAGIMVFSEDAMDVPPALAYCRHLSEGGMSVGDSLFLRACVDELTAEGHLIDGVVAFR